MAEGNEDLQLDPELWKELPEDLLERVIAKLPFSRVVAFRVVCKQWYSGVIPRAAAHLEASSGSALVYFSYHDPYSKDPYHMERTSLSVEHAKEQEGFAWWLPVGKANSEYLMIDSSVKVEEFRQRSFPAPRSGEYVKLLICEGGLLFFGFICRESKMARKVVVCNPLISQCKSLGLPCPIQPPYKWSNWLVGVVFDSKLRSYCFVYAGVDHGTYLYNSLTSSWTKGTSLLPALREGRGEIKIMLSTGSQRSVCRDGILYWSVAWISEPGFKFGRGRRQYVLKFHILQGTWSLIPNPFEDCRDIWQCCHIASFHGEILLWHLHRSVLVREPPQFIDWPCKSDRKVEMTPEINLMPEYMITELYQRIKEGGLDFASFEYGAFSQLNSIYHVVRNSMADLTILVQDSNENWAKKLVVLSWKRLNSSHPISSATNFWSFSPSLTSLP